jgi:hypothetical protein
LADHEIGVSRQRIVDGEGAQTLADDDVRTGWRDGAQYMTRLIGQNPELVPIRLQWVLVLRIREN